MSEASNGTYTIHILGKKYEVPAGLTIMKSIEYAGYRLTHGCGCRGGVCGACATIYRMENDTKWHICLACQTNAADGMHLVQLPYVPSYRASYDVTKEECTPETVARFYPTLKRCMGCNTCMCWITFRPSSRATLRPPGNFPSNASRAACAPPAVRASWPP